MTPDSGTQFHLESSSKTDLVSLDSRFHMR
jgi:hypothetical protein